MSELPKDVLFEIALHLDGVDLRNFCRSNQKASRICSDPYFRDTWIKYHDQLSFEQRQTIDAMLDRLIDNVIDILMDYSDFEYPTYIDFLKDNIKEDFRKNIGRDLRSYIGYKYLYSEKQLQNMNKITRELMKEENKRPPNPETLYLPTNAVANIFMDYLPFDAEGSMSDDIYDFIYKTLNRIAKYLKIKFD